MDDRLADFIGLPFLAGGQDRNGLDCWGLFALLQREVFCRDLPPYEGPAWVKGANSAAVGAAASAHAAQDFVQVMPGAEQPGDGILIRMRGHPIHVATVIGGGHMLHIEEACLSVVEPYRSMRWERRIVSFHRWAGGRL